MSRKYAVIEKYRDAASTTKVAPSLYQLEVIRDGLILLVSLDEVATLTGFEPSRILDEIATLGKWLIHTNGGIDVTIETVNASAQMSLLQDAAFKSGPVTHGKGVKTKVHKKSGKRVSTNIPKGLPTRKIVIPAGFEAGRLGRDVVKALSAIIVYAPDSSTLTRYTARTYPPVRQSVLTFSILTTVWKFAEIGRLNDVDQVAPGNSSLMNLIVAAYDVLDTTITRAHEGVSELCEYAKNAGLKGVDLDLEAVKRSCEKARLLNEAEMLRLESRVGLAVNSGSNATLATELRYFTQHVAAAPSKYQIKDIADLNPAQVRRIAEVAGVQTGSEDKETATEVRSRLKALGATEDLDRFVSAGVQASQLNRLDEFFEAMSLRVTGDHSWAAQLSELFG